ncbi:MAG: glycine cleavage system protein GcvH [Alphaproteobacteria bacterium]|nr:glycine cleavage system protein GcvH [Alphaproteobacteria bacterium]
MNSIYFTKEHEWIKIIDDTGTIGITSYAQEQLGDIVFVDLPTPGQKVKQGKEIAVVESVKAASEVYAPVDGEIIESNTSLQEEPGLVNSDPAGKGWFVKMHISDKNQLTNLMTEEDYKNFIKG